MIFAADAFTLPAFTITPHYAADVFAMPSLRHYFAAIFTAVTLITFIDLECFFAIISPFHFAYCQMTFHAAIAIVIRALLPPPRFIFIDMRHEPRIRCC